MPLTCKECLVANSFEGFRDRGVSMIQRATIFGGKDFSVAFPIPSFRCTDPVGDAVPRREFPGHDARAGGTANLAGRVALRESHSAAGQLVDVRSFVVGAAFDADISYAQIIGEDEHEVGPCLNERAERQAEQEGEGSIHVDACSLDLPRDV